MCGIRLTFSYRQVVIVRLNDISGSQELLERTLVQHWLALHAGKLLRHGEYSASRRSRDTGSPYCSAIGRPNGRLKACNLLILAVFMLEPRRDRLASPCRIVQVIALLRIISCRPSL